MSGRRRSERRAVPDRRNGPVDRRKGPRRTDERLIERRRWAREVIRARFAHAWRGIALGLAIVLVVLMAAALIGFLVQGERDHEALHRSQLAQRTSEVALMRVEAEAAGLCTAIRLTRQQVDDAHGKIRRVFLDVARLEAAQARQLSHGISHGVRTAAKIGKRFAAEMKAAGDAIEYLAPIDCRELTAHPLTYREPQLQQYGSPGAPKG